MRSCATHVALNVMHFLGFRNLNQLGYLFVTAPKELSLILVQLTKRFMQRVELQRNGDPDSRVGVTDLPVARVGQPNYVDNVYIKMYQILLSSHTHLKKRMLLEPSPVKQHVLIMFLFGISSFLNL